MTVKVKIVKHDIRDYYYLKDNLGKWVRIDRECFELHTKGVYKSMNVEVVNGKRHTILEY